MSDYDDLANQAWTLVEANRLHEARSLFATLCELDENNPESWMMLGNLHAEFADLDLAIQCLHKAIALDPNYADAHYNLASVWVKQNKLEDAKSRCHLAVVCDPGFTDAWHLLGRLNSTLGNFTGAIECNQRAIELEPNNAVTHANLGLALWNAGNLQEAVTSYQCALGLNPKLVDAHLQLAAVYTQLNLDTKAEACYREIISSFPSQADAYKQLGKILAKQGKSEEAANIVRKGLDLTPNDIGMLHQLAVELQGQGKYEQALFYFQTALNLDQSNVASHNNIGIALASQGKTVEAMEHYRHALTLKPDYAEAHCNLGILLADRHKTEEAITYFEHALTLKRDYAEAHYNLATALAKQGNVDLASEHFKRTLVINPSHAKAYSNLLLGLNYSANITPAEIFDAHKAFGLRFDAQLAELTCSYRIERSPNRRLKIGYVSSDFRQHSVAYFIEPVLIHHDHEQFEVYCYFNHALEDKQTEKLKSYADHWRNINQLSDEQAAGLIVADGIDILIDLNGHTKGNRLQVFARKPAPMQLTWLGYPNTTGLLSMDYRITDNFADPVGMTEHLHTERLLRLPECFSCYKPPSDAPDVSSLPAFDAGCMTFGSFNNLTKITPEVISTWAKILLSAPGARLVLKNAALSEDKVREKLSQAFVDEGVAPGRLELLGSDPSQKSHLERYWHIDIGLDTFPYNGTTTTCDALWMGVPVITLAGSTHVSRVGVSQLSNLGLTELIAYSPNEYVSTALRLASDIGRLEGLRKELRSRMAASPLTNGQQFTRGLETAYREIYESPRLSRH